MFQLIYQILGKGAFATVYRATSKNYPHAVRAIKVIKK
jgi:serine/threonine protein kinase